MLVSLLFSFFILNGCYTPNGPVCTFGDRNYNNPHRWTIPYTRYDEYSPTNEKNCPSEEKIELKVDKLIENKSFNEPLAEYGNNTPLMIAINQGSVIAVQKFLEAGALVDKKTHKKLLVHQVLESSHPEEIKKKFCELLIKFSAPLLLIYDQTSVIQSKIEKTPNLQLLISGELEDRKKRLIKFFTATKEASPFHAAYLPPEMRVLILSFWCPHLFKLPTLNSR
jgi:hypothetical protein